MVGGRGGEGRRRRSSEGWWENRREVRRWRVGVGEVGFRGAFVVRVRCLPMLRYSCLRRSGFLECRTGLETHARTSNVV